MEVLMVILSIALFIFTAIGFMLLLFWLFVPLWGIVDCAVSKQQSDSSKALWILVMFFTWSFGAAIYGVAGTKSPGLRKTSRVLLAASFIVVFLALGGILLVPGLAHAPGPIGDWIRAQTKDDEQEKDTAAATGLGSAPRTALSAEDQFWAIQTVGLGERRAARSVVAFSAGVAASESAVPVEVRARHVAVDPQGPIFYVSTNHEVGKIASGASRFVELKTGTSVPRLSWVSGVAFDTNDRKLFVTTNAGEGTLYSFDPSSEAWQVVAPLQSIDFAAICYAPDERVLYGLQKDFGGETSERIVKLSTAGAVLGTLQLEPALPAPRSSDADPQLAYVNGKLIVLADDGSTYSIDPQTGRTSKAGERSEQ